MKILITGCAGLLGSRLAEYLIKTKPGVEVIGIDDLSGGYVENVPKGVIFYRYDIANTPHYIDRVFEAHEVDIVYHFAAYAAECVSPFIRRYNYINNLVGTAGIINACIKYDVKRLVFASSMAVYGQGTPPFSEDMPRNPVDPYGIAKAAAERDIEIAGEQHGLDWCIIRPHNVYGDKQNIWDKYRNVLGIWMYKNIRGLTLSIYGDGNQKRAFSYVDDCLSPLWNAAVSPLASKQIINLGGIQEYTINEAADTLIEVMGGGKKEYLEKRHEVFHAWATWQKSIDILGYKSTTTLKEGLTKMWDWAKNQPDRGQFKWGKYEVEKGIYSFWK